MKHNTLVDLIEEYGSEYLRTTGRSNKITYSGGWFTLPNGDKARAADIKKYLVTLKSRPTVTGRMESVNGVQTFVEAHQHVVTSYMVPHRQVIEDRDTPWNCSVASEAYWSN